MINGEKRHGTVRHTRVSLPSFWLVEFVPWNMDNERRASQSRRRGSRVSTLLGSPSCRELSWRKQTGPRFHCILVSLRRTGSKRKISSVGAVGNEGGGLHCRAIYPAFSRTTDTLNPFLGVPRARWVLWNRILLRPLIRRGLVPCCAASWFRSIERADAPGSFSMFGAPVAPSFGRCSLHAKQRLHFFFPLFLSSTNFLPGCYLFLTTIIFKLR